MPSFICERCHDEDAVRWIAALPCGCGDLAACGTCTVILTLYSHNEHPIVLTIQEVS